MMRVSSLLVILLLACTAFGQSSDKLKKEQDRLEKKIADTKSLLQKSKTKTSASLNELKVIENQIRYRENLLRNYDNQIRGAELTVQQKEQQIVELRQKVEVLKEQYRQLLLFAYKHRSEYGKIMFIFTAKSYNEAKKRNKYLRRISEIQMKQFLVIQQNQKLIAEEIEGIKKEKDYKLTVIEEKKKEREAIEKDKVKQLQVYEQFKAEEETILAKLKKEQRERENLKNKINAAIKKEIAAAEARRKKAEAEARAKAEAAAAANAPKEEAAKPAIILAETKEAALLSKSFEGNRGKLPWPVDKGTITERFGKNPHPTLKNVYTNNRGIDISASPNAQVRAVFDGEVTSVLNIPGAGKVVIIKHGNYRTVYSNLRDTYVKAGSKVTTKKVIGSLLTKSGESVSVSHFEVHKVSGSNVTCLNPSLWVAH